MHFAARLIGCDDRGLIAFRGDIADPFAEAACAETVGAAEEIDGVVRAVRRDARLHSAVVLVA